MKIWVTGAAGFLGTRVLAALAARGHEIVAIDRRAMPAAARSVTIELSADDACAQMQALARTAGPPDVLIHAASLQPADHRTVSEYVKGNLLTAAIVADALSPSPPAQIIYTSTISVYGRPQRVPVREEDPPNCEHPYAITKLAAEQVLAALQDCTQVTILRLASLYGVGQADSFIDGLARRAQAGEPIHLFSRGVFIKDVLPVGDVVRALAACIDTPPGERQCRMNLGAGRPRTMRDYAEMVVAALGSRSEVVLDEHPASQPYDLYADISKARREIGFVPTESAEAIRAYLDELRAQS